MDVNGHVATEAGREQRAENRSICVEHVGRAPPVCAHHVSDSTDLLVCVCVIVCSDFVVLYPSVISKIRWIKHLWKNRYIIIDNGNF